MPPLTDKKFKYFSFLELCETYLSKDKLDQRTAYYGSKVEECLKEMFKKADIADGEKCSKAIASLIEATNIDIQADPMLHRYVSNPLRGPGIYVCRAIT